MIRDNKIYFDYEGYESRFGEAHRPALVRYAKKYIRGDYYHEGEEIEIVTLYVDGRKIENKLDEQTTRFHDPYAVVLFEPNHSKQKDISAYNLVARPFNSGSQEDWYYLFYDTSEFHRMGDRLAYAIIAIALDKYYLNLPVITKALNMLREPAKSQIIDLIKSSSYGLSPSKISQINTLIQTFGRPADVFFPKVLEEAAKQYSINYDSLNVHCLVDALFEKAEEQDIERPLGFSRFIQWLKDDSSSLSLQELNACFPYLGEEERSLAIRRYFWDVKKGLLQYDIQSLKAFSSQNYQYYSTLRYIFEGWPGNRNVSTEFLLDCLKTYEQTNQERFQISDGILDWAIQKSIEVNRPIEMNFHDWLCYCQGGILINKDFRGFASFEIQYELDDFAFEDESLKSSIHSIVRQNCERLYHLETITQIDKNSGRPIIDPETNLPLTKEVSVYDNRWKLRNQGDKRLVNLFVNWDKRPETEQEDGVFTPEMVDYSIVRDNVEKYLIDKYGTITPYVSERQPDGIVKMFAYEIGMRVRLDDDVSLGENPGVDETVVKQRIRERMIELFGENLECEYNPTNYQKALVDSLFRKTCDSKQCFEKRPKMYRWERRIYCAPELSELPNLLTGRKCANCQGDLCFVTCIIKEPDWKELTLIHILEIIGYHILEETEAGLIPNPVYIQFVTQINKAIRFSKRLVCKECGHILFPAQQRGHTKFKCLLPACPEYNKEVYLNYCHDCKKGIIDSRETKQCPNGLYICPTCNSCCSNDYFEFMREKYRIQGKSIPAFITRNLGKGHRDQHMVFCYKCGSLKVDYVDDSGHHELRCPKCNPFNGGDDSSFGVISGNPPFDDEGMLQDPWA